MNINYKITTAVLAIILIATFAWQCGNRNEVNMGMNTMRGGHMMPDGSVMGNDRDMNSMMMDMTSRMKGKTGDELDRVFLEDMIVHHQGAIDMAKELQKGTKRPELQKMAEDIIRVQSGEIEMMREWLREWFKN
jgi:uncharacterized protein (DUF305 family)